MLHVGSNWTNRLLNCFVYLGDALKLTNDYIRLSLIPRFWLKYVMQTQLSEIGFETANFYHRRLRLGSVPKFFSTR